MAHPLWFFGSGAIAVPTLQALAAADTVLGVVTQPDRPQGRGQRATPTPVRAAAEALAVPVLTPPTARDPALADQIRRTQPAFLVVMAYGGLLPAPLLQAAEHGALNVHPSLLPRHRGAAPIPWAILRGDTETGITIFLMDARLDHGPFLRQARVPIQMTDTAVTLADRLGRQAPAVLLQALRDVTAGRARPTPQQEPLATLAPRLTKADAWMDWAVSSEILARRIRAFTPWPGSATSWQQFALKILRAEIGDVGPRPPGVPPGTVVTADASGIEVQAGHGTLRVCELQLASGRPMSAADFLRGHPMRPGHRLGAREKS